MNRVQNEDHRLCEASNLTPSPFSQNAIISRGLIVISPKLHRSHQKFNWLHQNSITCAKTQRIITPPESWEICSWCIPEWSGSGGSDGFCLCIYVYFMDSDIYALCICVFVFMYFCVYTCVFVYLSLAHSRVIRFRRVS